MALLKSQNLAGAFKAPDFKLKSVDGIDYDLASFSEYKVLAVMFICNHCPYVKAIEDRFIELEREFNGRGVQWLGICSNDAAEYPEDSPANLLKRWRDKDYRFPYLIDESQQVARDFGAVCTPDLYVFDSNRQLAYHGRLDDNWQFAAEVKQRDLANAVEALLVGQRPSSTQIPSMGCSIKWKNKSS